MFTPDVERTRAVATQLLTAYRADGVLGTQAMPEDVAPAGVATGSEEHLRFITLTVAIDYQRNADQLWEAGRRTYVDPETRYLYDPVAVADTGLRTLVSDMQRHGLSRKPDQDAQIWQQICHTLAARFDGQVGALIDRADITATRLLEMVRAAGYNFPFLKGPKIGPLWVRMLYDNCRVPLRRIEQVPLPVDVHTAQATLQLGCVRPLSPRGAMGELREVVQQVWREALTGSADYPLRMDEPLWLLSRQGCRVTRTWPCEFRGQCPVGEFCLDKQVSLAVAGNAGLDGAEWRVK